MKWLFRTLIILTAGLLVAGALFAFGQTSFASQMRAESPHGGHMEGRREGRFEGGSTGGFAGQSEGNFADLPEGSFAGRRPGRGEHHGPSLAGIVEAGESLAKIGIIVALFAIGARFIQLRRASR